MVILSWGTESSVTNIMYSLSMLIAKVYFHGRCFNQSIITILEVLAWLLSCLLETARLRLQERMQWIKWTGVSTFCINNDVDQYYLYLDYLDKILRKDHRKREIWKQSNGRNIKALNCLFVAYSYFFSYSFHS